MKLLIKKNDLLSYRVERILQDSNRSLRLLNNHRHKENAEEEFIPGKTVRFSVRKMLFDKYLLNYSLKSDLQILAQNDYE